MEQNLLPEFTTQHSARAVMIGSELKRTFSPWMVFVVICALAAPSALGQQKRPSGLTFISAPSALSGVLRGETPRSLDELRALERQQQAVARRVSKCTVSVQIDFAQGSGVIITKDGYVLTAAHVAMRPNLDVTLTLHDGRHVHGKTMGMNRNVDAGLIKIEDPPPEGGWPYASLGSSSGIVQGMWCIAAGHPGGYEKDRGVVIRIGRILATRDSSFVSDCALIGGDSGGPLFDLNGKLIAVHSRIGNDVTDNLHIPVDHYDKNWARLARAELWGQLPGFRPRIGVRRSQDDQSKNLGGALIASVEKGSASHQAGLVGGDLIVHFGDSGVTSFESLQAAVALTMPGEHVKVVFRRNNKLIATVLVVGRDPNY